MQQTGTKGVQLCLKGYLKRIDKEIKIWSYKQLVYVETRIYLSKWDA